jgi:hypothetical protein
MHGIAGTETIAVVVVVALLVLLAVVAVATVVTGKWGMALRLERDARLVVGRCI